MAQISSDRFAWLCTQLRRGRLADRQQWEWCYILQALFDGGVVRDGTHGLGFGVGTEPIASYLASHGCHVLATDPPVEAGPHQHGAATTRHPSPLESINVQGLCEPDLLEQRVSVRPMNMNDIPDDLVDFDFVWSSSALEHLGDLDAGLRFVERSMECLKPGGLAAHTTEFNVSSNDRTVETGETVAYRRRDLETLAERLRAAGHRIEITFGLGDRPEDRHIDVLPFTNTHLKVMLDEHVITSFGLIVRKRAEHS